MAFFFLGLLNNCPWVLMLACATNISAGGVALVFISNQIPGLLVKLTAPYWFHTVSYKVRIKMGSLAMGIACFLVGCGGLLRDEIVDRDNNNGGGDSAANNDNADAYTRLEKSMDEDNSGLGVEWLGLALELLGVCFISFQCSLGEVSLWIPVASCAVHYFVLLTFGHSHLMLFF